MACPHCGSSEIIAHDARRWFCKGCKTTISRKKYPDTRRELSEFASSKSTPITGKYFLLTCAVSSSPANVKFLRSMEYFASQTGAQIIVATVRYRNPTSNTETPVDTYAPEIVKYLRNDRIRMHKNLVFLTDVQIQPTNSRPLSGVETFTGQDSAVLPHPRIALTSVPTMVGSMAKLLLTTGAVTMPQYSQSFAGSKGEFNHSCGAALVHIRDDGKFDIRHIHAEKDGSFYDWDRHWFADRSEFANVESLTCGDLHGVNASPFMLRKTFFDTGSIVDVLKPKHIILHDTLDFESQSHHDDYFTRFEKRVSGKSNVWHEITETCHIVNKIARSCNAYVHLVASNHDEHLQKWLLNHEHADDLENAIIFHETRLAVLLSIKAGRRVDAWKYWADKLIDSDRVFVMRRDESLNILGVEHGFHGDKGANGSRGSTRSFSRIGVKVTKGHSHGPEIVDGCYSVGHSLDETKVGYIKGAPSSWLNSHVVQYASGKRTLITIV